MTDCGCHIELKNTQQRQVLLILLAINSSMFLIEILLGLISQSTALIADSLDMLADATVYGISLYAVGKPAMAKIKAAHISGIFQILLGLGVFLDILRRLFLGSEPQSLIMVYAGIAALIANTFCLILISRHKQDEVHMRASWIFSKNDVIANLGIILSGGLVYLLDSRFPDLMIGSAIALIVVRGGIHIIKESKQEKQQFSTTNCDTKSC